ncbi:MAG: 4Fe-4S binding protein [Acetatifactor sp.]|nr:4Fe-4S binding protein [Acetatifactor sp.]
MNQNKLKTKKSRKNLLQVSRHVTQLISFILFPGLFVILYNAIRDITIALMHGTFHLEELLPRLLIAGGILLITALAGRFFCGYVCLFGSVGDLIYSISKRTLKKKVNIPANIDHKLRWLKYGVLAFLVIGVWGLALPVSTSLSPWYAFGGLVSGNASSFFAGIKTIGFILLLLIVIASFFIERFFCRYLCPLGAIFSIISRKRFYTIDRDTDKCTSCGLCSKNCSMGLNPHKDEHMRSGECINCMNCVASCPTKRLAPCIAPASSNPKTKSTITALSGIFAAIAIIGLMFGAKLLPEESPKPVVSTASNEAAIESSSNSAYADGIYTGTGMGFRGEVSAEVKVKDGAVESITILDHSDDDEFFNRSNVTISSEIIATQSLDIDGVSGATFSSKGILSAVDDALSNASTQAD